MVRVGVIGAGPAGCLTARRLADAGHDVVLFEAGERVAPTLDFASLLERRDLRWPDDPVTPALIRARAVGGASTINGMLLSAPDTTDLASWEVALGLLPGAARSSLERVIADVAPQIATPGPLARSMSAAAVAAGEAIGGSTLDVDATGVLVAGLAARSGERRDAAAVYLDGAPERIRLVSGTTIASLDDVQLAGFDHVVVCAGALASPALVASAMPNVAVSVPQQHRAVALSVSLRPDQRVERDQPAVSRLVRWSSGLDPDDQRADVQLVILDHMGWSEAGRSQGLVIVSLLAGSTLGQPPTALDQSRLRLGLRRAAELLAASGHPVDSLDTGSFDPGSLDDSALDRWIARQPNPVHHLTSTLALGSSVGPAGLVAGRDALSVIDASVLPDSPRADTNVPVMVIADLLAGQLVDLLASRSNRRQ